MCIICYKAAGERMPNKREFTNMFVNNPDGCGYMFARDGKVIIRKGFDNLQDYFRSLRMDKITKNDVIVFHFRIATQAFGLQMTQPFPITAKSEKLIAWDSTADVGLAHNGIIRKTTNGDVNFSDTALYIQKYIAGREITDEFVKEVERDAGGRMVFLKGNGEAFFTGDWVKKDGLMFSNYSFLQRRM